MTDQGIECAILRNCSSIPNLDSAALFSFNSCFFIRCWEEKTVMSVDDSWKIGQCREQRKKLSDLEMELAAARQEGFVSKHLPEMNRTPKKRQVVVIGILTGFGRRNKRDAVRQGWMGTGVSLKKMEDQKGVIVRFVIGRSSNQGDSLEMSINDENKQTNDIFIPENHVEAPEELPNKTKLFFVHAAESWHADFYAKVNDDVYVNVDALGHTLASHFDKPRVYIGCMKSEKFSMNRATNGLNQTGGNLEMEKLTSAMPQVRCL